MKRLYYFLLGVNICGILAYFIQPHSFEGFIAGGIIMLLFIFSEEVKENE